MRLRKITEVRFFFLILFSLSSCNEGGMPGGVGADTLAQGKVNPKPIDDGAFWEASVIMLKARISEARIGTCVPKAVAYHLTRDLVLKTGAKDAHELEMAFEKMFIVDADGKFCLRKVE